MTPPPQLPDRYIHDDPPRSLSGGYGEVWVVRDTFLDRLVAYKRIKDPRMAHTIAREVELLARARSRNVVDIFDCIYDDDGNAEAFVVELLEGRSFDPTTPLDVTDLLLVLFQVASGLADLHSIGIVHRDVKPANFRESVSGIVKLFDFGISADELVHRTRENRGTIGFAAPELYEPKASLTELVDIYAFGVTAWMLAAGKLPRQLSEQPPMRSGPPPALDKVVTETPPQLADLIGRCTAPIPDDRPSAAECAALIERLILKGRHRGTFAYEQTKELRALDATRPSTIVNVKNVGSVTLNYDGFEFNVAAFSGNVFINNTQIVVGQAVPDACVVTFGTPSDGSARQHVAFSASHPGVEL